MGKDEMHCGCGATKMGVLITLFGLVFLLGSLGVISQAAVSSLWPTVIVIAGLLKIAKGCACAKGKK